MGRYVLLDAGPLGLGCCNPAQPKTIRCLACLDGLRASGVVILILAIADHEVRRELLFTRATAKLARLAKLRQELGFLDIRRTALEKAAEFWAILRQTGFPTAGDDTLDADAILAGMASTLAQPGVSVVVATTNMKHLARFTGVDAQNWETLA